MTTQPISTLIRFATPLLASMLLATACTDHVVEEVTLSDAEFDEALSDAEAGGQIILLSEERTDRIVQSDEGALGKVSSIEVVLELESGFLATRRHSCTVSCTGQGCVPLGCDATSSGCSSAARCTGHGVRCSPPTCSKTTSPQT